MRSGARQARCNQTHRWPTVAVYGRPSLRLPRTTPDRRAMSSKCWKAARRIGKHAEGRSDRCVNERAGALNRQAFLVNTHLDCRRSQLFGIHRHALLATEHESATVTPGQLVLPTLRPAPTRTSCPRRPQVATLRFWPVLSGKRVNVQTLSTTVRRITRQASERGIVVQSRPRLRLLLADSGPSWPLRSAATDANRSFTRSNAG